MLARRVCPTLVAVVLLSASVSTARAGLYYSGETFAELPSQWRGFLLDQRALRNIAVAPAKPKDANRVRTRYLEAAAHLEKKAGKLTADEAADLGALYVRLGQAGKAVTLLRSARRDHPNHFRIVANLGTAWQRFGDLAQAAQCLQQAVRLAPGKYQQAEEFHLKLVRQRLQAKAAGELDDLFGVRYVGDDGAYETGRIAAAQWKRLPARGVAIVQQLALSLPADGLLLWQLAELANATGDVKTAAAMMDGCVTQFGLNHPELRRHRLLTRAAADRAKEKPPTPHAKHVALMRPRSQRPLLSALDQAPLPPINPTGVTPLPWDVLAQTVVNAKFRPTFAKYLRDLDGKQVSLQGYMQPIGANPDLAAFLFIEYPIGCWYCEMPEVTSIVYVALPAGRTIPFHRGVMRVTGRLMLNATDPEDFLYALRQAKVSELD